MNPVYKEFKKKKNEVKIQADDSLTKQFVRFAIVTLVEVILVIAFLALLTWCYMADDSTDRQLGLTTLLIVGSAVVYILVSVMLKEE